MLGKSLPQFHVPYCSENSSGCPKGSSLWLIRATNMRISLGTSPVWPFNVTSVETPSFSSSAGKRIVATHKTMWDPSRTEGQQRFSFQKPTAIKRTDKINTVHVTANTGILVFWVPANSAFSYPSCGRSPSCRNPSESSAALLVLLWFLPLSAQTSYISEGWSKSLLSIQKKLFSSQRWCFRVLGHLCWSGTK